MYKISKSFSFSAAHQLNGLPNTHQCSRLHGHNYVVTVHAKSDNLDDRGFVQDYTEFSKIKEYINNVLDHKFLNDIMGPINSTAENIAKMIYDIFKSEYPKIYAIEVSETPKTSAIYYES